MGYYALYHHNTTEKLTYLFLHHLLLVYYPEVPMLVKPEEKEEMEATASEPDQKSSFMTAKISVVQGRNMRSMSLPAPNFDVSAFASSHEEQPLSNKVSYF